MGKEWGFRMMRKDAKYYPIGKKVKVFFRDGLSQILDFVDFDSLIHDSEKKQNVFRWDFNF